MANLRPLLVVTSLLLAGLIAACFRQDILTVTLDVPQMRSSDCQQIVLRALDNLDQEAIINARFDVAAGEVTITYNSMSLGLKNIEHAIAAAGFAVNALPANEEARLTLPPGCQ